MPDVLKKKNTRHVLKRIDKDIRKKKVAVQTEQKMKTRSQIE